MQRARRIPTARFLPLGLPVLGICYGVQLMAHFLGGKVEHGGKREYGHGQLKLTHKCALFDGLGKAMDVWNSHGDKLYQAAARLPRHRTHG